MQTNYALIPINMFYTKALILFSRSRLLFDIKIDFTSTSGIRKPTKWQIRQFSVKVHIRTYNAHNN